MTVLSDKDIRWEFEKGDLEVEPVDLEEQLQPASLDIRLGKEISEFKHSYGPPLNSSKSISEEMHSYQISNDDSIVISPGAFFLINTFENIKIPDYLGCELRGRSSIGRLGLEIHSCAGWIDPGFKGDIVLEISNNSPRAVEIEPGMRIGQLVFYDMTSVAQKSYGERNNKYQGQQGAVASRINEDDA